MRQRMTAAPQKADALAVNGLFRGVPIPDLKLAAQSAKERPIACLLMGLALFEIRHHGAQLNIRGI